MLCHYEMMQICFWGFLVLLLVQDLWKKSICIYITVHEHIVELELWLTNLIKLQNKGHLLLKCLFYILQHDINSKKSSICLLLTEASEWNMTTRPPLSPVASNSPSWLNSTHEIISAAKKLSWKLVRLYISYQWECYQPSCENQSKYTASNHSQLHADIYNTKGRKVTATPRDCKDPNIKRLMLEEFAFYTLHQYPTPQGLAEPSNL